MLQEAIMSPLPSAIAEVFEELKNEVSWLNAKWIIYRQLFAHSEKRIKLLNECASACFRIIHDTLLGEVQITISKLTDPALMKENVNLSLEQLQKLCEAQGEDDFVKSLQVQLIDLKNKYRAIRIRRNKELAHFDLTTILQSNLNPLPGISRKMIKEALEMISNYMNTIEVHYTGSETGYEHFLMNGSDGEALISMLKYGLRYEELIEDMNMFLKEQGQGQWQDA
jgi:hypothetical protein